MPTDSDDNLVCLPRPPISNPHGMLIEKPRWTNSFEELDTSAADILGHVFFFVGIVRYAIGIG
jgi:hypothetical protein